MLFADPLVTVRAAVNDELEIQNGSARAITQLRRSARFPGSHTVRACPMELELPAESTTHIAPSFLCAKQDDKARVPLVLSRSDGSQLLVLADVAVEAAGPVLPTTRVAELVTKVGADGALALTAPDGTKACACEGAVIGAEQVKLIRAEKDCVLVEYPDNSQRCLEAQE
jgi:hypothetical protein